MTQQEAHERLVEDVAAVLCNLDEGQPPDSEFGRRIMSHRDSPHRGDCTKEPFTCVRCLYIIEAKRAETVLSLILSRLGDVTPEMVEAYERNYDNSIGEAENVCVSDWRAMLAASCLGETKP